MTFSEKDQQKKWFRPALKDLTLKMPDNINVTTAARTEEDEQNQSMFLIATDENLTNTHLLWLVIYLK